MRAALILTERESLIKNENMILLSKMKQIQTGKKVTRNYSAFDYSLEMKVTSSSSF